MSKYKDIELGMERNIYGDIPVREDYNSIKSTLYNNLLLNHDEIPFENEAKLDIRDIVHEQDNFITRMQLKDAITQAANLDRRIKEIKDIDIDTSKDYEWVVKLKLSIDFKTGLGETIDMSLVLDRE